MRQDCILLVEPDLLVRHPLAEYLRECGYTGVEATTADEARQLIAGSGTPVDIVLTDIDAPGGSGFALAQWIRVNHPAIDVILAGTVTKVTQTAESLCEDWTAAVAKCTRTQHSGAE